MIIEPTGGLGNYMRTIFSYYAKCKKLNEKLIVIWKVTDETNGYFLDYFEEVDGIEFLRTNDKKLKVNYRGCFMAPGFQPDYSVLKLKPNMKEKLDKIRRELGPKYISVHIRRTDHIQLAKRHNAFTPDEEFIKFIKLNPDYPLYLATDNLETQLQFKELFPEQIKSMAIIEDKRERRKTSLEQAILDVYLCAYSIKFRRSAYSSFTNLIEKIRVLL